MTKLNRTLLSATALLLVLAGCHSSSIDSRATTALPPQHYQQQPPRTTSVNSSDNYQNTNTEEPSSASTAQRYEIYSPVNHTASKTLEAQLANATDAVQEKMIIRLDSLMYDPFLEKSQMGIYIYDLTKNQPLFEYGKRQSMRPASTMKVITAITALAQLGTDYQYSTHLYISGSKQSHTLSGHLYVKGGFDPLTGNNAINKFVSAVSKRGIKRIKGDLVIDLTMKDDKEAGWGWCWDDKNPSLSPLLYHEKPNFAAVFQQALKRRGITITGHIRTGRVPSTAQLIDTYHTSIDKALQPMMKMSVNQVAESMFFQIGLQLGKPYISHRTSAAYVKQFIRNNLDLIPEDYRIADGSGLSLYNYITPELLVAALRYAYQNQDIYRHLLPSLPIAGEDGTLKNRMRYTSAHGNVCAKTGTVTGICSLAGYATSKNGHRLCFAIINQGQMRGSEARVFQDKICYIMTE